MALVYFPVAFLAQCCYQIVICLYPAALSTAPIAMRGLYLLTATAMLAIKLADPFEQFLVPDIPTFRKHFRLSALVSKIYEFFSSINP